MVAVRDAKLHAQIDCIVPITQAIQSLQPVGGGRHASQRDVSVIRFDIHPRAIIGDRRRRRAVVHEIPGAQELGCGGDVGVEHGLDHRPADFLDHPDADLTAVRGGEKREGQDVRRARDRETRPRSVSVGAPEASFWTSCQFVWVPRWNLMPMQFTTADNVKVVASAAVEP